MAGANRPGWRVTLEGRDLTATMAPRLLSLTLTEKSDGEADQLDITLHDHDGKLDIPKPGKVLRVAIGWAQGVDVAAGLVEKGSFKVDEAEWSGPPDIVTIRARSADLAGGYRQRKEKSWTDTTLGAVVREIAGRNKLTPKISPALASLPVKSLAQDGRSDMALVRLLGRRHDAVATVKDGKLIFAPRGKGASASGKPLKRATITRSAGDGYRYTRVDRSQSNGVEARWHDQGEAKRKTVKAGVAEGQEGKPRRLKRVYGSEAEAQAAAEAEARRIKRGAAEFEINLALGRPDLIPEGPVTLQGFKREPDGRKWTIAELTHNIDASGGYRTKVKLETA
jgi:uncharacterized protein